MLETSRSYFPSSQLTSFSLPSTWINCIRYPKTVCWHSTSVFRQIWKDFKKYMKEKHHGCHGTHWPQLQLIPPPKAKVCWRFIILSLPARGQLRLLECPCGLICLRSTLTLRTKEDVLLFNTHPRILGYVWGVVAQWYRARPQARDRAFDTRLRWMCSDNVLLGKALCSHVQSLDPGVSTW